RREVFLRIVAKRFEQSSVGGKRTRRTHQQVIAVRCQLDGGGRAGIAACTWTIVDDEILTERFRHLMQQDARDNVARAPTRKGHNHLDRSGRIILCLDTPPADKRRNKQRERHWQSNRFSDFCHYLPPGLRIRLSRRMRGSMRASFRRPTYRLADLHFVIVAQLAADARSEERR